MTRSVTAENGYQSFEECNYSQGWLFASVKNLDSIMSSWNDAIVVVAKTNFF